MVRVLGNRPARSTTAIRKIALAMGISQVFGGLGVVQYSFARKPPFHHAFHDPFAVFHRQRKLTKQSCLDSSRSVWLMPLHCGTFLRAFADPFCDHGTNLFCSSHVPISYEFENRVFGWATFKLRARASGLLPTDMKLLGACAPLHSWPGVQLQVPHYHADKWMVLHEVHVSHPETQNPKP